MISPMPTVNIKNGILPGAPYAYRKTNGTIRVLLKTGGIRVGAEMSRLCVPQYSKHAKTLSFNRYSGTMKSIYYAHFTDKETEFQSVLKVPQ